MKANDYNVNIVRINGEDNFAIKILDEKYLNLVYKYDKLNVVDDVLSFEINIIDNPNNIAQDILDGKEFSNFVSNYLISILEAQLERDSNNDIRENNPEELSEE